MRSERPRADPVGVTPVGPRPHNGAVSDEPRRDEPWLMRTYSGHSTARASNQLYRTNLAQGQTGLSIAFDLPTQTGYDPDHPWPGARSARSASPVVHLGHMRTLLDGIPPGGMNTSMTINAAAAWLWASTWPTPGAGVEREALGHHAERHRQGVPVPGPTSSRRGSPAG